MTYICLECGVILHRPFRDLPECPECGGPVERKEGKSTLEIRRLPPVDLIGVGRQRSGNG